VGEGGVGKGGVGGKLGDGGGRAVRGKTGRRKRVGEEELKYEG